MGEKVVCKLSTLQQQSRWLGLAFFLAACSGVVTRTSGSSKTSTTAISPSLSTLEISNDGGSTYTQSLAQVLSGHAAKVRVKLKDKNGQTLTGVASDEVVLSVVGGTSTGQFSAVVSLPDGTVMADFTGNVAGTPTTMNAKVLGETLTSTLPQVQVVPGEVSLAQSAVSLGSGTVATGSTTTATFIAKDAQGNRLTSGGLTITFSTSGGTAAGSFGSVTDNHDGSYTATFTATTAGTATAVGAQINGVPITQATPPQVTVVPNNSSLAQSAVSLSSSTVASGSSVTVTLTAKDSGGTRLTTGGQNIAFAVSGGGSTATVSAVTDHGDGTYTATLTGVAAGSASTVSATMDGSAVTSTLPTLTVSAGSVSLSQSLVSVSATSVISGSSVTVTLTAKDANGNQLASGGSTVVFSRSGGTSTGSFGSVTDHGDGTYTASFTGTTSGTATSIGATLDGSALTSTKPTVSVTSASLSLSHTTVTVSSATVNSGASVTVTLTAKDANDNVLSSAGGTVAFSNSGGTSTGTFGSVTDHGDGTYTASFTGVTAGSATTINATVGGSSVTNTLPTVSVGPGAASLSNSVLTVGSSNLNLGSSTTLTLTVKDANSNVTSGGDTVVFSVSSGNAGNSISSTTDHSNGTYTASLTATSTGTDLTISATINGSAITSTLPTISVTDVTPRSVGGLTSFRINVTGDLQPISSTTWDGSLPAPYGVFNDGTYLYVSDTTNYRITKIRLSDGAVMGWIGKVTSLTGISGCTSPVVNQAAPGWCLGGTSGAGTGDGMLNGLTFLWGDGTYLYMSDTSNQRVSRFNASTGAFAGWIGQVWTTTGISGCSGATAAAKAPSWCFGGTSSSGTGDGMFNQPAGVWGDGTYLYVADHSNARIEKFDQSTGSFIGWIGKIATSPGGGDSGCSGASVGTFTPGWCTGGTSSSGSGDGPMNQPNGIWGYGTLGQANAYLYVADMGNARISRFNRDTGAFGGWIGRISNVTGLGGGTGCSTAAVSTFTPDWCTGGTANGNSTAGDGNLGISEGLYTDGSYIYETDYTQHRINRYAVSNGAWSGWIGEIAGTSGLGGGTGCSSAAAQTLTPAWCTGGSSTTEARMDGGLYRPYGISGYNGTLYVASALNYRVNAYTASSGAFVGAIGTIVESTAPAWTAQDNSKFYAASYQDSGFDTPVGVTHDGSSLYVADNANGRLKKYDLNTGTYQGWIGKIGGSYHNADNMTGATGCSTAGLNGTTPGWCFGGISSNTSSGDNNYQSPQNIVNDGTYLYVASNVRIHRIIASSGVYAGWVGNVGGTTPALSGDTGCSTATVNTITPGWCKGGYATATTAWNGVNSPKGLYYYNHNLYLLDSGRIARFNADTGLATGWIGKIGNVTGLGGDTGCSTALVNTYTPGWCTGGTSTTSSTNDGSLSAGPVGIGGDGTYLYVSDNNAIKRYKISDGSFQGWIGKIANTTGGISGGGTCSSAVAGNITPNWCIGGQSASGSVDGAFFNPGIPWADATYLYVPDGTNHRITRSALTDGSFAGWQGVVNSTTGLGGTGCSGTATGSLTPGWCTGGSSQSGVTVGGFNTPAGIFGDAKYLYVLEKGNHRLTRLPK